MASLNVAIEIGTSFVTIYASGAGVVLREPTVIAFVGDGEDRKVLAVGARAVRMQGKAPERTTVVCPVSEGYIVDDDACVLLLAELIKKIIPDECIFFPRIKALLAVPTGLTVEERKVYEDVLMKAGVSEVDTVSGILTSALGFDLAVTSPDGFLVANIGGGVTEIAVISMGGIISGCSVNVGGSMMDRAVVDYLVGKYGFKVGVNTARLVKEEIGSLYPNDISSVEVKGVSVNTLTPTTRSVYATDIYDALLPYYARVSDAIESILKLCPPELASGVQDKGLQLCGGASKIPGLTRVVKEVLGIPVTVSSEPDYVSISGAGRLLEDKELYKLILSQQ